MPYLFLTGYQSSIIPEAYRAAPVLAKPADAAALRSALQGLLPEMPAPPSAAVPDNLVLRRLAADDRRALEAHLEPTMLGAGDILERPGVPASHLVFPSSGVISIETGAPGSSQQMAMIGREGVAGSSLLFGPAGGSHTATVRYPGSGRRIRAVEVRTLMAENPGLRDGLLGATGTMIAQMSFNALAAARCTIEQRVGRWLLMVSQRLGSDDIPLTHDTLSRMLAVRRSGVTVALHVLEGKGAVRSTRGRVRIVDHERLAELAGPIGPA